MGESFPLNFIRWRHEINQDDARKVVSLDHVAFIWWYCDPSMSYEQIKDHLETLFLQNKNLGVGFRYFGEEDSELTDEQRGAVEKYVHIAKLTLVADVPFADDFEDDYYKSELESALSEYPALASALLAEPDEPIYPPPPPVYYPGGSTFYNFNPEGAVFIDLDSLLVLLKENRVKFPVEMLDPIDDISQVIPPLIFDNDSHFPYLLLVATLVNCLGSDVKVLNFWANSGGSASRFMKAMKPYLDGKYQDNNFSKQERKKPDEIENLLIATLNKQYRNGAQSSVTHHIAEVIDELWSLDGVTEYWESDDAKDKRFKAVRKIVNTGGQNCTDREITAVLRLVSPINMRSAC